MRLHDFSPIIKSGKFVAGIDLECGANVTIDVAEKMVVGDRVTLPANAHFEGRRITIGDDFFGYAHEWRRLDVGRGRRDEEEAVLHVGSRCTFHDNKIDLAKKVFIGSDVGLSPEVTIYTHGYWQSSLHGYPCDYESVDIGDGAIIGYRSTLLSGARVGCYTVVGAHSLVTNELLNNSVYAGVPAKRIKAIEVPPLQTRMSRLRAIMDDYRRSLAYRNIQGSWEIDYPLVLSRTASFDVETLKVEGEENQFTDDFREFAFKRGLRFFTKRRFRKLPKQ